METKFWLHQSSRRTEDHPLHLRRAHSAAQTSRQRREDRFLVTDRDAKPYRGVLLLSPHLRFLLGRFSFALDGGECWSCARGDPMTLLRLDHGFLKVISRRIASVRSSSCHDGVWPYVRTTPKTLYPPQPHSSPRGRPGKPELRPCLNAVASLACWQDDARR